MDKPETTILKGTTKRPAVQPSIAAFTDSAKVDKHLVGGIAWTAAAKWSNQVLSWAFMLVVARLLSPSDFGLVGIAVVYFDLATNLSEFGVGSAIVTLRDLTSEQVRGLNTFSLLAGLVGFVFSCGVAVPLGVFFRAPLLPPVVVAMSTSFLISGFQTVPKALLQKELRFKLLSIVDAVQALAQTLAVLSFALWGFGHWALVIGILVAAMTRTVCMVAWCHPGFARPRFRAIKRAVIFSWHVVVSRMAWTTYTDADFIVAGRVLGTAPLGAYTFAWNFANAPVDKIASVVTGVTPAFFSAVQMDHAAMRRYLRTLTEGLSMVTIPATLGLALVASELVPLALGTKWQAVVVPLQILACYAAFRSITTLLGQVLTALGETRFVMWNTLAAFVLLPTAFLIGSRWGAAGIAWGWIVGYPLVALPLYWRTFRGINMKVSEYFGAVRPSLGGSLTMVALILLLKWALPAPWPLLFRFGLEVLTGAITYCVFMLTFHRGRVLAFWYLMQRKEHRPV